MQVIVFLLMICVQVSAPQPGETYAALGEDVVLRAGPTENHVGLLSLPAGTVVRAGQVRGSFREVFLAGGFPIYLHGDFARVDATEQLVSVDAERVNARLLPSTIGLLPVGQVGQGDGALELLAVEGDWVRVLAPLGMPLFVRTEQLLEQGAGTAQVAWQRALTTRGAERERRAALSRAGDADWLARHDLELELDWLTRSDARALPDAELAARRERLSALSGRALALSGAETSAELAREALAQVEAEQSRRTALAADAAQRVRDQVADEARLEAEARALGMGLRFLGRGDAVDIQGVVTRRSSSSSKAEVYSISDGRRSFKLSSGEVVELPKLVGQTVVLRGRSLTLVSVDGPVLIVDEVLDIKG